MAALQIHTYHCLCTSLLLASTHKLSSLPRRALPSLDNAIIVRLPPTPQLSSSKLPSSFEGESEGDARADGVHDSSTKKPAHTLSNPGHTLLLSTTLDRRPTMIRRSDGFEKRYLLRCGRCRLVVGYELDAEHYTASAEVNGGAAEAVDAETGNETGPEDKERTKLVYLLPGGIMSTEVMAAGKKISDQEVALGESERMAIAAWE